MICSCVIRHVRLILSVLLTSIVVRGISHLLMMSITAAIIVSSWVIGNKVSVVVRGVILFLLLMMILLLLLLPLLLGAPTALTMRWLIVRVHTLNR